jgi:hypothetical protein
MLGVGVGCATGVERGHPGVDWICFLDRCRIGEDASLPMEVRQGEKVQLWSGQVQSQSKLRLKQQLAQ